MKGLPALPQRAFDAGIALAVGLLGAISGLGAEHQGQHASAAATVVLTMMGLILYLRRRFPGPVLAVEAICVAVLVALGVKLDGAFLAVIISSYSAAVYGSRRLATALAVVAAALLVGVGLPDALHPHSWLRAHFPVPTVLAAAGAWLIGLVIRRQFDARNAHAAALAERAELMEERASNAILAERLRIARELHDIVGHHLSVVVIQAQGAQRMADRDATRALAAMADVECTGRIALDEMRRLLGLLRTGEAGADEAGAYGPALGLADVEDLAERMRGTGLPVKILREGEPRDVPDDVGLTVYRIVQESLTNVLKHAGPASATVRLCFGEDLDVTVTDDGRGAAAELGQPAAPGAGRGTTGMTERVAALGGKLSFGPQPGGGYQVHARIPI